MRTADINEGDIWADDWSDEFSWLYEGNEYENALADDLDDIFDANLSDAEDENPEKPAVESLIEISEEQEDDEEDASAAMPALPMIAEAAHILEPFLPIEKLPGVCQTQGFRVWRQYRQNNSQAFPTIRRRQHIPSLFPLLCHLKSC